MKLTREVKIAIEEARRHLTTSKFNDLTLSQRISIMMQIETIGDNYKAHQVRTKIAILCVEKVIPIWKSNYLSNDFPEKTLILAEKIIRKEVSQEEIKSMGNAYYAEFERYDNRVRASMVGWAALEAVNVSINDERWLENTEERDEILANESSDEDFDPHLWTVSYRCAVASGDLGTLEFREFWEWYLNEAVPQAFESTR